MAIRVKKKRLLIGEDVQEVYAERAMKALKNIFGTMSTSPRRAAAKYMQQHRGDIARLNSVAKRVREPGLGLDMAVTKMTNMRYSRLEVFEVRRTKFLAGQTRDLIIEEIRGESGDIYAYWDCGDYNIYVPVSALATSNIHKIHFVPVDHRTATDRHFHHTASVPDRSFEHPTEMKPHTCWSDFAEPVMTALEMCDIPELFELLRIFVGRYYEGSPLSEPYWREKIL